MKKVLVLGAQRGALPLVDAFQKMGYYVIVAGKGTNYPCCHTANKVYDVDLNNYDELVKIGKEEGIVAVTSNVLERAIRPTAWVAEKLGLEGISYKTAKVFTNKYLMRAAAEKSGVCVPHYAKAECVEEAIQFAEKYGFPLMIKPVDNGGSKGVVKIHSMEDLKNNFDYSLSQSISDGLVIIEEFIEGTEYIVDAFTHNYKCENTNVSTKEIFDLKDYCVVKNVILKSAVKCNSMIEKKLKETNIKCVEGMHLKFGITHANYIYNEETDSVYLVEVTARGGGDFISSNLVELATGINVSHLLACYSLGINYIEENGFDITKGYGASAWFGFALPEGTVCDISGVNECKDIKGVYKVIDDNFYIGKKVEKMKVLADKFGPILIYGKDRDECKEIFNKVKNTLKVKVNDNGIIKNMIW